VINKERARNDQLWGWGGQSSRSYEAEDRFICLMLVDASFLTPVGQLAFLVYATNAAADHHEKTQEAQLRLRQLALFVTVNSCVPTHCDAMCWYRILADNQ